MLSTNAGGRIVFWSQPARERLGWTTDEVLGRRAVADHERRSAARRPPRGQVGGEALQAHALPRRRGDDLRLARVGRQLDDALQARREPAEPR